GVVHSQLFHTRRAPGCPVHLSGFLAPRGPKKISNILVIALECHLDGAIMSSERRTVMKLAKLISHRIRTLREAAGLSQQEVAVKGDLSRSLVAKLEQGKKADPRASTLLALAQALNVRPGELLENLTPPPAEAVALEGPDVADGAPAKKKGKHKK